MSEFHSIGSATAPSEILELFKGGYLSIAETIDTLEPVFRARTPALPSGEVEPVAWLYETWCGEDHWSQRYTDAKPAGSKWERNIRPLYLAAPQPTSPLFSRWADTIESASLTIGPAGSKELDALAVEVRAYDVSKL